MPLKSPLESICLNILLSLPSDQNIISKYLQRDRIWAGCLHLLPSYGRHSPHTKAHIYWSVSRPAIFQRLACSVMTLGKQLLVGYLKLPDQETTDKSQGHTCEKQAPETIQASANSWSENVPLVKPLQKHQGPSRNPNLLFFSNAIPCLSLNFTDQDSRCWGLKGPNK